MSKSHRDWIQALITASCIAFIFVLALSAVFDPTIRVLHTLQAFIYIAVIVLSKKKSAWGYGAGCIMAAFWNWINLVHTNFIASGMRQLSQLVRTGDLQRPDLLIAVFAAAAHFAIIAGCLLAFARKPNKTSADLGRFLGGGVLAIAWMVLIIVTTGRQYIPLLRRVFGIE
ncbi:MAG: hypothetical protein ACREMA_02150 [Longimicrobiales bacterium]